MSDPPAQPPEPETGPPAPPDVEPVRRHHLLPWLTGAGFVVLAVALIWVWQHPSVPPPTGQSEALARRIDNLEARVSQLEQRPAPNIPDLGPLSARVAALEQRPQSIAAAPVAVPDLAPLDRRVAALEQRQAADLGPLEASVAALQRDSNAAQDALSQRVSAVENRLAASQKAAQRISLIAGATLALAAGQKLGDLPGAPPALARFANAAPPTEASLRLSFAPAAREALAAAQPDVEGKPVLTRLWAKAQDLVTIRQGDHVLVGDPNAGVLDRARTDLDAGDLASAVAEVEKLQGKAAQAMAGWLAQARSLLDARAALAMLAAPG